MSLARFLSKAWNSRIRIRFESGAEELVTPALAEPGLEPPAVDAPPWSTILRDSLANHAHALPEDAPPKPGPIRKTYYVDSPPAAFRLAERDLGPSAVLLASLRTPPSLQHLGRYELTFASEETASKEAGPLAPAQAPDGFSAVLRQYMSPPASGGPVICRTAPPPPLPSASWARAHILRHLTANEIPYALAESILQQATRELAHHGSNPGGGDQQSWVAATRAALFRFLRTDSAVVPSPATRAILLVGPSAAGKTSTAAKLAVLAGRQHPDLKIRFINFQATWKLDHHALDVVADLLGAPVASARSTDELEAALDSAGANDFLIIDTYGFSRASLEELTPISKFLAKHRDINVELVLPATLRLEDSMRFVDRFELLRPSRLLFTMLDLTPARGGILREAARTGKPLSFCGCGESITDGLKPADPVEIIDAVLAGIQENAAENHAVHR